MGKQARNKRRARNAFLEAHQVEARLVDHVHASLSHTWTEVCDTIREYTQQRRVIQGSTKIVYGMTYTADDLIDIRHGRAADGWTWPDWCYLPTPVQLAHLNNACDWGAIAEVDLDPMYPSAAALIGVGAFHAAPLVARFDDDLADAVMATPLTGTVPFDSLLRLPTWSVAIPVPWLRPDGVALVFAISGRVAVPGVTPPEDETSDAIVTMLMSPDTPPVVLMLRCTEDTIEKSIMSQLFENDVRADQIPGSLWNVLQQEMFDRYGDVSAIEVLQKVLALALYVSSEQADIVDVVALEPTQQRRRAASVSATPIVDVGFRIGSALRAYRTRRVADHDSVPTGLTQTPHLRSAHWHTYWFGPRSQPELRYRATRWLPPIKVNFGDDGTPTTIRDVAPPPNPETSPAC